jgi:hypothetical protein
MATRRAVANGNWSATGTWNGGVLPGNGDTVYSNGFTVTIDQNITIGGANNPLVSAGSFVSGQWYEITSVGTTSFTGIGASANTVGIVFLATGVGSGTGQARARATISTATNAAAGATTGGGGFTMSTTYNMDCDIRAGTSVCLTLSGSNNATISNAIVIGGTTASSHGLSNTSSGTVTLNSSPLLEASTLSLTAHAVFHNTSTGILSVNSCPRIMTQSNSGNSICNNLAGTVNVANSNITGGALGFGGMTAILNVSTGTISVDSSTLTGGSGTSASSHAIRNNGSGSIVVTNSTIISGPSSNGVTAHAILNASNGTISISSSTITALNGVPAIDSTNASATNRFSGTFISSANGTQPFNAIRWILNSSPTASYIQHALNGINANSFVRYYTADNGLGQANPTDVRSGVSYASGNLTGRLTVPARGSVALSVNYGPSMPFTATRTGTTATATLVYSYPLVVGDEFTVTGASNSEWNTTYTIASVISGTSVTFTVPNTHSATEGAGARMQTTGTAVLDPAAVASAVWGAATRTLTAGAGISASDVWSHASRTITGGLVDTATTLTNAPTVPSVVQIRQEMDANSTKLVNLDATVSSRLASSVSTNITSIKAKTDLLNTDRLAQCATTSIVGSLIAQSNS